jgi:hypothetical protein
MSFARLRTRCVTRCLMLQRRRASHDPPRRVLARQPLLLTPTRSPALCLSLSVSLPLSLSLSRIPLSATPETTNSNTCTTCLCAHMCMCMHLALTLARALSVKCTSRRADVPRTRARAGAEQDSVDDPAATTTSRGCCRGSHPQGGGRVHGRLG